MCAYKRSNISSHYGPGPSPGGIGTRYHEGPDIAFLIETKILACEKGTVTSAGWNGGFGKCVIIDHGNGPKTDYAHMIRAEVKSGQKVLRGQVIGRVGNQVIPEDTPSSGRSCKWKVCES